MSLADIYGGDFLKAEHIQDRWPVQVTIKASEIVKYDDGKRQIALHFNETDKKLGLNKTNANRIAETLGNEDWQGAWIGQTITLVLENVEFQGKMGPAIRVKMPELRPPSFEQQAAQTPPPETSQLTDDDVPW